MPIFLLYRGPEIQIAHPTQILTMISNERNFSLAINGERTCGQDIRNQNVTAVMSIANVVKSSLGPVGLDKMMVDNIGVRTTFNA